MGEDQLPPYSGPLWPQISLYVIAVVLSVLLLAIIGAAFVV